MRWREGHAFSVVLTAVALTCCAHSTGVLPVGPDTYTLTERLDMGLGHGEEAQQKALSEANAYCAQQGRQLATIKMDDVAAASAPYWTVRYSVTFKCLAPAPANSN